MRAPYFDHPLSLTLFLFALSNFLVFHVSGLDCSPSVHCATGCCSQYGFCGTGDACCGAGCLSTCDYQLGCDAKNPCSDGSCCSKFGFCGLGSDYCSSANCVAGCTAKAECDPGNFGAAYVNYTQCPLNVCCSKWGFCGTTEEFCGDKMVTRPSCPSSQNTVQRVVGYYEGWASRRLCQAFVPENIPAGVYTHLNFAFASIDPNTFQVVPADAGDVDLYSRLTALKKQDSALKVFISIGGWDFNNLGPTATTFSDLAASTSHQATFFASLISFMSTYNFDGVDIDWEYPGADDRSGRPQDFANFPSFLKNLKSALVSSSGGRTGLTITLPVSYWYLQDFDIVNLEPSIDFFNIMSYDLHGLWDKGNKWLGPFLNSHTNLTEITEYLDLLWRNNIVPSKVNMGLAFYSRTFVASDPACLAAGCTFDAVGEPGPCTNSLGTLSNAELTNKIVAAGASPKLDPDAAVEIVAIGREWITYDDANSWNLKLGFARGECLGGVMVWAVSQDSTDGAYSKQLQSVTQLTSVAIREFDVADGDTVSGPNPLVVRNQCLWANCGQSCPAGYTGVPRVDKDASKGENMQDGSRCRGGQLRIFCCPSSQAIPKCGWFDFNNGNCGKKYNSVCPAGSQQLLGPTSSEVASLSIACHTKGGFQVACCETDPAGNSLSSVISYASCVWDGTPPNDCSDAARVPPTVGRQEVCVLFDAPMTYMPFESSSGSGAVSCYGSGSTLANRGYCCLPFHVDSQWLNCQSVFPRIGDDGFCEAYCPDGTVRMAMEDPPVYLGCKGGNGGQTRCCTPDWLTEATNSGEVQEAYVEALKDVAINKCSWTSTGTLELRTAGPGDSGGSIVDVDVPLPTPPPESGGEQQQSRGNEKRVGSNGHQYNCNLAFADTFALLGANDPSQLVIYTNGWNEAMNGLGFTNLPASRIANEPSGVAFGSISPALQTMLVQDVLSSIPEAKCRVPRR